MDDDWKTNFEINRFSNIKITGYLNGKRKLFNHPKNLLNQNLNLKRLSEIIQRIYLKSPRFGKKQAEVNMVYPPKKILTENFEGK